MVNPYCQYLHQNEETYWNFVQMILQVLLLYHIAQTSDERNVQFEQCGTRGVLVESSFLRKGSQAAAAAWDPFLRKDIDLIEDVQKYGLKVCLKSWSANYSELLERSHLPTLQARRREAKLCHLYKIVNKETFFPDAPTYHTPVVQFTRKLSFPYMLIRHNSCTPSSQVPYLRGTRYP